MFCTFFSRQNDFLYSWRTFLVLIRSIPQAPYKALINGVFHDLCHNRVFNLEHFRPAAWWNVTAVNGNRVDLDNKWCIMGRKSFQILCFCFAIWAAAHTQYLFTWFLTTLLLWRLKSIFTTAPGPYIRVIL